MWTQLFKTKEEDLKVFKKSYTNKECNKFTLSTYVFQANTWGVEGTKA
jgi:hypothetical protein